MVNLGKWVVALILFMSLSANCLAEEKKKSSIDEASFEKQASYALGYDIFKRLNEYADMDLEMFIKGAQDSRGKDLLIPPERMQELLTDYQEMARQKQLEKIQKQAEANKADGLKFLEENKLKEGVITLSSGLQYKVMEEGDGVMPKATDTVECHYKGTLIDGTIFDSSYRRGKPSTFQVGGVIPGWVEALQKMKVGSKWMLFIPPDLAYGDRGAGAVIKPGSTLIFEVELLGIVK